MKFSLHMSLNVSNLDETVMPCLTCDGMVGHGIAARRLSRNRLSVRASIMQEKQQPAMPAATFPSTPLHLSSDFASCGSGASALAPLIVLPILLFWSLLQKRKRSIGLCGEDMGDTTFITCKGMSAAVMACPQHLHCMSGASCRAEPPSRAPWPAPSYGRAHCRQNLRM